MSKNVNFAGQSKNWTPSQKTGITNQGEEKLVMFALIKKENCITVLIIKERRKKEPGGSPYSRGTVCQTHDCNEEALRRAFGGDVR
ncbi:hypothetical protein [Bombella sp. ESL0385]|uniref:hypothetical protein n=1 Tax=Bombella sp. ESL0385 TaxID=2676446 RepID=UPI001E60F9DE|nr:hypothetical protein [Bombella sp. ESL0385]